jgi:hypothetical protein
MTDLQLRLLALRELGPSAILRYATYRVALGSGLIRRRTPLQGWQSRPFEGWVTDDIPRRPSDYAAYRAQTIGPRFFFDATAPGLPWTAKEPAPEDLKREADEILGGRFRLFGGDAVALGFPPDWGAFPPPLTGRPRMESDRHWSDVRLDEDGADVRLAWELSRFGWIFPLARAYRWTGEAAYAEAGWSLIDDWRRAHPPNAGVQWASAQEVGLRLLALAFAERAFFPEWSGKPERLQTLAQLVGMHAARIPPTLEYAQAQDNNHLLSEAAGLYTTGLLFPELRESGRYRGLGRRLLESGLSRQVFEDGGYVQHSTNYQRLALALAVWSARLADLSGEPLPQSALDAIRRLARSLAVQAHHESGQAPSFGPDDGTDVLRLACAESRDVRPVTAAASRLILGESWYQPGLWDETSAWLGLGQGARTDGPHAQSLPDAGLHFLEGRETRGSLRCVRFRQRPGHSDQLHVDLWRGGEPFAFDPGSYLYNGPPPWQDGLAGALVHNAPIVDGLEPMRRAGRFLWADRAQGRFVGRWQADQLQVVRGEHNGYRRLGVTLTRTLALVEGDAWLVVDVAQGAGRRRLSVGWNLPDVAWRWAPAGLSLSTDRGELRLGWDEGIARAGLARAGQWIAGDELEGPLDRWGWTSPRYSAITPCLRLVLEIAGDCPLALRTRLAHGAQWSQAMVRVWEDPASLELRLAGPQQMDRPR